MARVFSSCHESPQGLRGHYNPIPPGFLVPYALYRELCKVSNTVASGRHAVGNEIGWVVGYSLQNTSTDIERVDLSRVTRPFSQKGDGFIVLEPLNAADRIAIRGGRHGQDHFRSWRLREPICVP